jgi:hypothetical protein
MGFSIFLQPSLRLHLTDLVNVVRQLHLETDHFLKERAALYVSVPPFLQSILMEFHFHFKISELAAQPGKEIGFVVIARGLRAAQMHRHQRPGALYHVGRSRLPFLFTHSILFILFHSAQSCSSQQEQSAQTYPTLLALRSYPVHYHQHLLITIIHHLLKQTKTN